MLSLYALRLWATCVLFGSASVLAHPALSDAVPFTIIPGEGLPSLESLSLTMKDLLDPRFDGGLWANRLKSQLSTVPMVINTAIPQRRPDNMLADFPHLEDMRPTQTTNGRQTVNISCQGDWGEVSAAQACANYLSTLGTQACVAAPSTTFCVATDDVATQVVGFSFETAAGAINASSSSATCVNVACAVAGLIDSCSQINPGGCEPVGGFASACGSVDLGIWVGGRINNQSC